MPCKTVQEWADTETKKLVRVEDILNYMRVGFFISKLTRGEGDLFRKVKLDYTQPFWDLYMSWRGEIDQKAHLRENHRGDSQGTYATHKVKYQNRSHEVLPGTFIKEN